MRKASAALLLLLLVLPALAAPVMTQPWHIQFDGPRTADQPGFTENGLRLTGAPGVPWMVMAPNAQGFCWSTDRRHGLYQLAMQGPPLPDLREPMPVTVTVDYFDRGTGQWALAYDAANYKLEPYRTHSRVIQNHDTGLFKTEDFFLPDAALCSAPTGWWLAVDSFGEMVEEHDVYVVQITVKLGGVSLVSDTPVAAPGQPVICNLWARDAHGEPIATGKMDLRLDTIQLSTRLNATGAAAFAVCAPLHSGTYEVQASTGAASTEIPLLVWPGHGALQPESALVDTANKLETWAYWPVAAEVTNGRIREGGEDGGSWLHYSFTGAYFPGYVDLTKRTPLRGLPLDVNLEVQGETHGARLEAILEDATGQRFCYALGELIWPQWTELRGSLSGPTRYWGGAADGVPHYPLSFLSLRLLQGPAGSAAAGQIELRNVFVRTLAPAP